MKKKLTSHRKMKAFLYFNIFTILLFFINLTLFASPVANQILQEDIVVITDREIYIAGEEIAISLFTVEAITNMPVNFSSYGYIELINSKNETLQNTTVRLRNASATTNITLENTVPTGVYAIRAYSQWMRNFDIETICFIKVINPYTTLQKSDIERISPATISIFPEGGKIVSGVLNKIWFSISMPDLNVEETTIRLYENDSIIEYEKASMSNNGYLTFTPDSSKNYWLELVGENENIIDRKPLKIDPDAVSLILEKKSERYDIKIQSPAPENTWLKLLHSGTVIFEEKTYGNTLQKAFDFRRLPPGISYFIITDEEDNVLNWRPVSPPPQITSVHQKISFQHGSVDSLNINELLALKKEDFVTGSASLKIFHDGKDTSLENEDISLLTSPNLQKKPSLRKQKIVYSPELEKYQVSGVVKEFGTEKPVTNERIFMSVISPFKAFRHTKTDSAGRFTFNCDPAIEPMQFLFYGDPAKTYLLTIDEKYTKNFNKILFPHFYVSESEKKLIEKMVLNVQVQMAYRQENNSTISLGTAQKSFFYGKPDETIRMEKYIDLPTMEEVFRELSRAVFLTREKGELNINILDRYQNRIIGPNPYVFIDGILVQDQATIFEMDPGLLESIHLLESKYYFGELSMDGIIDIRTKSGNSTVYEDFAFYSIYEEKGVTPIPENNDFQRYTDENLPYYPNTIFHKSIKYEIQNAGQLIPYPDRKGKYLLTLKGIQPNGQIILKSSIIEFE